MNNKLEEKINFLINSQNKNGRLKKRHAAEKRFKLYGFIAIFLALSILAFLLVSIIYRGHPAFVQTHMQLAFYLDEKIIDPDGDRVINSLKSANYAKIVRNSLQDIFPGANSRKTKRQLKRMISSEVQYQLQDLVVKDPLLIGSSITMWVKTSANIDSLHKGHIPQNVPESDRLVSDLQLSWYNDLVKSDKIKLKFNSTFFTSAASREPELAGILGALIGSALTLIVTLIISFPIGMMAAVYLEEFAPKNKITDFIEVNINNLAAVPSIVFGLLGLGIFLNFLDLPRSAPIVGGMVLALMTLPTIIISARASLKAVPPSIREAALAIGASPMQVVLHHVLPLAMPGSLTGTIIGMARALGESAPLLMIGMVAFIVDLPRNFLDAATVLPVQIYLWSDFPERAFVEKTSAAIIVLLVFLILMNLCAVVLRRKFERRW